MPCYSLIYTSSAVSPFSTAALLGLLAQLRERNAPLGLTGIVQYKGGNFMQLIEGPEPIVQGTYARIARDPRHTGVIVLRDQAEAHPLFDECTMGFVDYNDPEARLAPGFSHFMNDAWMDDFNLSRLPARERMLRNFRRRM